ncbi:hypothetical protein Tsubulata_011276 [Turnera subulata]|uniref:Uncharacterized protein n=1 Tax=Turnera subulata TaxID=218843 RepID=A0A9Q0G5M8_9ROSI|nr:hypothetical protein Tsubulata_011276 [Turnera subulata]
MEIELESRVKALSYKVKGMSRESPSSKASHVLDTDLRSHWSTSTNTKEWILLELDEPCLLSHIRIYNKSVLEWEIAVGLRYKPETFVKVRPRCEAPRRDMIYPTNYTPCRYVRVSCLRGNPIAIFFIQLIGVTVTGLEPEFQPVVNHLLPQIISHKQDQQDVYLQLLQDMTNRLHIFLPQLEADLTNFVDAPEQSLHFLAMLAGPFYPILHIVNERETARSSSQISDSEVHKNIQLSSSLTVSSNFEPRKSRSLSSFVSSTSSSTVFRPDAIFVLLRKAYKESHLGTVCRMACRILHRLIEPVAVQEASSSTDEVSSSLDEASKAESFNPHPLVDYSSLFGEEFQIPNDQWDPRIINVLDIAAVEEGILHVLYACASQPLFCCKLAESTSLRPSATGHVDHFSDNFSLWKQPFVQQALSQIVATSCSALFHPLLHACAGYLSSFSPSHVSFSQSAITICILQAKAACVLIDLCSSALAPWMVQVVAKIDLAMELLEDLLGTIQGARHSLARARAALKYIVLALSGHMDDILGKYKEVKHKILFLLELLEPFLDPAIYAFKSAVAFGDVSFTFLEKQEQNCVIALNIIRTAAQKSAVLPSLESEWMRGSVAPSVLLSILEPHMQLPPEIDQCRPPVSKNLEHDASSAHCHSPVLHHRGASCKPSNQDEVDGKVDNSDTGAKMDVCEDVSLLFAPSELRTIVLTNVSGSPKGNLLEANSKDSNSELIWLINNNCANLFENGLVLDVGLNVEYFNLQLDYFQLRNYRDCELRASEFRRLALDLNSQKEIAVEGHDAAIDALLLAAECYMNPFFMMSLRSSLKHTGPMNICEGSNAKTFPEPGNASIKHISGSDTIALLEKRRDKIVLELVLEAAELDRKFHWTMDVESLCYPEEIDEQIVNLSPLDVQSADAVTLVRRNQALLCNFLIQRLKKEQHSMHEILMHCLVFLLHSATQLCCTPEAVIDIILESSEYLNRMLTSFYYQFKEGNLKLDPGTIHEVQRRWMLLQRLVIASSGGKGSDFTINANDGFRCGNLIPQSAWLDKISSFSCSSWPLVRFLGWMAVSRNAKQFMVERLFLATDLSQLTYILSIFADELAVVDNVVSLKHEDGSMEHLGMNQDQSFDRSFELANQSRIDYSFHVIYPDLSKFFPNLKRKFETFGENLLEAVGLQLRSMPSSAVPDILCWFSDLCSWPFFQSQSNSDHFKGYVAKNARAIILYILEAIVVEHMEAMVPEIPRVAQVLVSVCRASYCDVPFLESVMQLLKPIISYSLRKVSDEEKMPSDDSCLNFESLCFEELFADIRHRNENQEISADRNYSRALIIYILASVYGDLSFQRRIEILESLTLWADFTAFEPTASFRDYLFAFQIVLEKCKIMLVQYLKTFGVLPLQLPHFSDVSGAPNCDNRLKMHSCFLNDVCCNSSPLNFSESKNNDSDGMASNIRDCNLSAQEIEGFYKDLEHLIGNLNPSIEVCWNLHHHLARKLTVTSARCLIYSRCLSLIVPQVQNDEETGGETSLQTKSIDQFPVHWKFSLEGLAEVIVKLQENHCWEVASLVLDCLLGVPYCFQLDNVIDAICLVIKNFSCSAPKLAWRLRSDKWLSMLFARGVFGPNECDGPLTDLFVTLLCHNEPEQRFIALQQLGKVVGQDISGEAIPQSLISCDKLLPSRSIFSVPESFLSLLVSSTWDQVVLLASSETLLPLRTRAMALLVGYIPYAPRHHLQSFLTAADSILPVLGKMVYPTCEGPLLQLSLALIAGACLYSAVEDISMISPPVWRNIETIGLRKGSKLGDLEAKVCQVLCRLKNEEDDAKQVLKEALASNSSKEVDADFGSTRESILQVLVNLSSVQAYFDMFSRKTDEEETELEEAEVELEILQKELALGESSRISQGDRQTSWVIDPAKEANRLQQIKKQIHSLEKSKLQENIVARRQKKLLIRHVRQKYLEEATLHEQELLQELDRERTAEAEKEIERQRLLELERAKTRELRHNLDMEKERQTQRELQRELEQAESGLRSNRRDFSLSTQARQRDRYRERENGRSSNEGNARTASVSLQPEISASSSSSMAVPTVVLNSSRPFSSQPPTILQSRDRQDDCGSSYEENFDGSKDSGDASSVGDPDVIPFDAQTSGYGSAQRHGSRGSKSRQVMERREGRERDGRREGKWERKHS